MDRICPNCGAAYFAEEAWKRTCLQCWIDKQNAGEPKQKKRGNPYARSHTQVDSIEPDMLKTLINLCHPDRHSGKESATRATQFLLSLRAK